MNPKLYRILIERTVIEQAEAMVPAYSEDHASKQVSKLYQDDKFTPWEYAEDEGEKGGRAISIKEVGVDSSPITSLESAMRLVNHAVMAKLKKLMDGKPFVTSKNIEKFIEEELDGSEAEKTTSRKHNES